MSNSAFAFLDSLPSPPNFNVADIKGNASDEEKLSAAKGFFHYFPGVFGSDILKRLRVTTMNFDEGKRECEFISEIQISSNMCNFMGVLHGACSTLLADVGMSMAVIMLGMKLGFDGRVLTRDMKTNFSYPGLADETIEVIASSGILKNGVPTARCEIRNKNSAKICMTAIQSLGRPTTKL
ncbi:hypothetical protein R3P38DRAFT_1281676 [Favolaschia claudopus]|uniref:Thioesterase domain-containing protein n=1 Tax=Favolaschia claudopus TaxID=2862362 RepID=A0AAW0AZ92_9AGAR